VIIGEDELARGIVQVRDLKNSTQREIARDAVVSELAAASNAEQAMTRDDSGFSARGARGG
jgi:hypothetical protein